MIENENVSQEETNTPETTVEQTETANLTDENTENTETVEKDRDGDPSSPKTADESNSTELTRDVLDKAISIAKSGGKVWEEITQEERWEYIKQSRTLN